MSAFQDQLFGAWRASGLDALPGLDGLTFVCPRCADHARLEVEDGIASCPFCSWGETGEPWVIAQAAVRARPVEKSATDIGAMLARARFCLTRPPVAPQPLFSLAGHTIATAENLMVVQAKMKAGKSAAIGAMLASTMRVGDGDCLHFASSNTEGRAVLHFDTEQSSWDHFQLIKRSLTRAGRAEAPAWLYSYHLKGLSIAMARAAVAGALEMAAQECGGVHSFMVDGIADLCADVNDPAEANALVAEMEAAAMKHRTLGICVLHENHSSADGKTRGHLGSQLARKAETNLRLEKNQDGATIMYADTSRSVHIGKKQAPAFQWSDDEQRHVSIETIGTLAGAKEREEMREIAGMLKRHGDGEGVTYGELRSAIMMGLACSDATAERKIKKMNDAFMITKKDSRYFSL